jgi:DNA mismatch repair protein MutS2
MDLHTLSLLEFDKVRDLLAGYTVTSLGKELALHLEPGTDAGRIRADLRLVTEMTRALEAGHVPPFGGVRDVRLVVRRAAIGTMLSAAELLDVAETLTATGAIYRYRARLDERHTGLNDLLTGVEDLGAVAKTIGGCIDGRGHVLDMASPALATVRQQLFDLDEKVKSEIRRLLRDPELRKALSYPNATVHGDHHVLPVAANHRHKVPGVVHRVSGTGETVYVEPAAVAHLGAERVALKGEEDREVRRILRRLSGDVARVARPLGYALDVIARLDLIAAKGKWSRDYAMDEPDVNMDGKLWLRNARHPLLEHLFRGSEFGVRNSESNPENSALHTPHSALKKVTPIDVRLGYGFNLLVVTGPNTGGKTVTLKTTGLLCLMAQAGMHVPAGEGSTVPAFRHVLADIGDEQSLEQSLSTFSSHVSRIAAIFAAADRESLVLLDELGAGTDPVEGAALGRAILDQLDAVGCRAIVTTHLGDLKTYAFHNPRAENGAVEFDVETLRPTYRLLIGQFGMSNALKIAARLNLPPALIDRAKAYLEERSGSTADLARLQEVRAEAERAKAEALAAKHAAEREKEAFEAKATELERAAEAAAELNEKRVTLRPNDKVHVARFDKTGTVVRVDPKKQTVLVSVGLGQWEVPFDEVFPEET